ncbi:MAG TPA: CpaF family protein [Bdellovibrionales bacterium]|nr:CpaF family protein [Bdellovibrionales bacterium]
MMIDEAEENVFEAAIRNFLGPVVPLLEDKEVSEILINGPKEVFVEKGGKLFRTTAQFRDEDSLRAAVTNIAQSVGRRINEEEPRLDARLPDGSRIHAVIPPCARNGTTVSIRKFLKSSMNFKEYVRIGAISKDAAQFLDICMFLGKNILISGGTGSGKTTLLGMLCGRIPKGQRVIVIEDASELTIDYEHVVRFETRMADPQGKGEVSMKDLVKSSLRLRPDRIILGEVRGSEALDLVSAMNTGHKGCLGTIHANAPHEAIVRLEALAMGSDTKISEKAIQQQIVSGVNLVVQVNRFSDGSRRVAAISEMGPLEGNQYTMTPVFDMGTVSLAADGKVIGELKATGHLPTFMAEIEAFRIPFPRTKFTPAA